MTRNEINEEAITHLRAMTEELVNGEMRGMDIDDVSELFGAMAGVILATSNDSEEKVG